MVLVVACTPRQTATIPQPTVAATVPQPTTAQATAAVLPAATLSAVPCAELSAPTDVTPPTAPAVVALAAAGDLWVWRNGDAAAQRVAIGDAQNAWPSPDGTLLAILREPGSAESRANGPQSLWLSNADGSQLREIATSAELEADLGDTGTGARLGGVQWLPGSHSLIWQVSPSVVDGFGGPMPTIIRRVNADTWEKDVMPFELDRGVLSWSPDGRQVAVGLEDAVSLMDAAGKQIAYSPSIGAIVGYGEGNRVVWPVWSTNGQVLVAAAPQVNPFSSGSYAGQDVPFDLVQFQPPDMSPQRLGQINGDLLSGPLFSPDVSMFAYHTGSAAGAEPDLRVSNVEATWDITIPDATFVGWSPDNRHFLFRPAEPDSLFVSQLCGDAVQVIGSPESDADGPAQWLDAERFVFLDTDEEEERGAWRLRLGRLDGTSTELASFSSGERPSLAANR